MPDQPSSAVSDVTVVGGIRISSPWFVDASGFATCLLAREFNLPAILYGRTSQ